MEAALLLRLGQADDHAYARAECTAAEAVRANASSDEWKRQLVLDKLAGDPRKRWTSSGVGGGGRWGDEPYWHALAGGTHRHVPTFRHAPGELPRATRWTIRGLQESPYGFLPTADAAPQPMEPFVTLQACVDLHNWKRGPALVRFV